MFGWCIAMSANYDTILGIVALTSGTYLLQTYYHSTNYT